MCRISRLVVVTLLLVVACPPKAAAATGVDAWGGFSCLVNSRFDWFGWGAGVGVDLRPWLQVVGDAGGYYWHDGRRLHTAHAILAGVRIAMPASVSPFLGATVGPLVGSESGDHDHNPMTVVGWAVALGGGVDFRLARRLALRAQADALVFGVEDEHFWCARLQASLVVRFGSR